MSEPCWSAATSAAMPETRAAETARSDCRERRAMVTRGSCGMLQNERLRCAKVWSHREKCGRDSEGTGASPARTGRDGIGAKFKREAFWAGDQKPTPLPPFHAAPRITVHHLLQGPLTSTTAMMNPQPSHAAPRRRAPPPGDPIHAPVTTLPSRCRAWIKHTGPAVPLSQRPVLTVSAKVLGDFGRARASTQFAHWVKGGW